MVNTLNLPLNDRQLIEHMLNEKKSLSQMASILRRDASGLRKEIQNYRIESKYKCQLKNGQKCAIKIPHFY